MSEEFRLLLSPLQLKGLTLKNRVVFLPHLVQYADGHLPSERELHYYQERARGGAGLIIYGSMTVQARSNLSRDCFAFDEKVIPGFKAVAEAVHQHGTYIFAQINHYGNQSLPGLTLEDHDWQPLLAPSAVPNELMRESPKAMEAEDFQEVLSGYADAARNVQAAGLDGVEVNMGHASLLRQFLSPHTNLRKDGYGGSLENRLRFPLEVLREVRSKLGNEFPIAVRLCLDEFLPTGLGLQETKEIAEELETSGLVDLIIADLGVYTSPHIMDPPMAVPLGYAVYASAMLKETVDLPIVAFGRINDAYQAEKILQEGHADLIGLARQLICDPDFPNKVAQGRLEDIRTCMGCNQGCFGRCWRNLPITCTQNPAAGRENIWGNGRLTQAPESRRVMVVGGGPAGLKAAEVAARRGHRVLLYEKEADLGGQVRVLSRAPNRENFAECVRYLEGQLAKLPVEIHLSESADADTIAQVKPDVIILATGALPDRPDLPGTDLPHVGSVGDLLSGRLPVGQNVVIYDTEGFWTAASAAQFLLNQKKSVQLVTPNPTVGIHIDYPALFALNLDIFGKGLVVIPNTSLTRIETGRVDTANIWNGQPGELDRVDTIVLATGFVAEDRLYHEVKDKFVQVFRIGDCLAPRRVDNAIYDGERIGRII